MVDKISKEMRSKIMRSIRSKDTKPELTVRKLLTRLGYRYRIHKCDIPGKPDIVFPGRKKAIFIHGCFWHCHENCVTGRIPEGEYWQKKIKSNQARDRNVLLKLDALGWKSLTLWECELANLATIQSRLIDFLGPVRL